MLTVKQAADRAAVSASLIYRWVAEGLLPSYRPGGRGRRGKILISVEDLDQLMSSFKVAGQPTEAAPPLRHIRI